MSEKRGAFVFMCLVLEALLILAFVLNGTADSGDSVNHYLYARYATVHPYNFFDPWAKPLFVLLAAPFAQFGFTGIKIFNIIVTITAMVATYFTAKRLQLNNPWFVAVLLVVAPFNMLLALSGLTEPLFATLLICGLCLLFYNKPVAGAIVLSFLPFVRSEGMFMLLFVGAYMILNKNFKQVLWLGTGQVVYSIVGYFRFKNFLWFYKLNPYSLKSQYGHGLWDKYFNYLPLIVGIATEAMLWLGLATVIVMSIRSIFKKGTFPKQMLLIAILFAVFFTFHVVAWRYGLFSSFGMARIITAVMPLMTLLALYGLQVIPGFIKADKAKKITAYTLMALLVIINIYDFIGRRQVYIGEAGLATTLWADQKAEKEMADYIKQKYPDYKNKILVYDACYISMALDVDPFTDKHHYGLEEDGKLPANSYCIWDDWFAPVEGGIKLDMLAKDTTAIRDTCFAETDWFGGQRKVILFRKN